MQQLEVERAKEVFVKAAMVCGLNLPDALGELADCLDTTNPQLVLPSLSSKDTDGSSRFWITFFTAYLEKCVTKWWERCTSRDRGANRGLWIACYEPLWLAGCNLQIAIWSDHVTKNCEGIIAAVSDKGDVVSEKDRVAVMGYIERRINVVRGALVSFQEHNRETMAATLEGFY
jgi:hypothetical protein